MRPLCVLFLQFLVKSIVISKLKVKKQKLLRHPVPGYLLGFGPCDLAFQERGGSVHLWEGWLLGSMEPTHGTKLTPAGKVRSEGDVDLRENGSFGNPRSTTGKKPSQVHGWTPSARASSFRDTRLVQEILCPSTFSYKTSSPFKFIAVSLQKMIRTQTFKGRRDTTQLQVGLTGSEVLGVASWKLKREGKACRPRFFLAGCRSSPS